MAKYTLLKNRLTGERAVYVSGGVDYTGYKVLERVDPIEYARLRKLAKNNIHKRQTNELLRELCGTSAKAAREDMGL